MQEKVLRHYFSGELTVQDLKTDLDGAVVEHPLFEEHPIDDMEGYFEVQVAHLASLCDEVLQGNLAPDDLEPIGVALAASTHFVWNEHTVEGKRIALTVFDWASPEDSEPLSRESVARHRARLVGD